MVWNPQGMGMYCVNSCDTEEGTVVWGSRKTSVQIQALPAVPIWGAPGLSESSSLSYMEGPSFCQRLWEPRTTRCFIFWSIVGASVCYLSFISIIVFIPHHLCFSLLSGDSPIELAPRPLHLGSWASQGWTSSLSCSSQILAWQAVSAQYLLGELIVEEKPWALYSVSRRHVWNMCYESQRPLKVSTCS